MGRVLPVVIALVLAIYALIDCLQTDSSRLRSLNKLAWTAIIILIPVVGPILWIVAAKRGAQPRPARPAPSPPVAPDDNPEFLRQLRNLDDEHEKLLNDWEASLRRREEEVRKQNPKAEPGNGEPPPEQDDTQRSESNAEEELRKRGDGAGDDEQR